MNIEDVRRQSTTPLGARNPPLRPARSGDLGSVPMRLAVIPGDGIGPEVVAEGLKVLGGVAPDIESTTYDLGAGTTLHGVATLATEVGSLFGTDQTSVGSCASCPEFVVGSDYINKIEARAPAPAVVYTNLATRYDELVSPYTSSFLSGSHVTNILMQDGCALDASDHLLRCLAGCCYRPARRVCCLRRSAVSQRRRSR